MRRPLRVVTGGGKGLGMYGNGWDTSALPAWPGTAPLHPEHGCGEPTSWGRPRAGFSPGGEGFVGAPGNSSRRLSLSLDVSSSNSSKSQRPGGGGFGPPRRDHLQLGSALLQGFGGAAAPGRDPGWDSCCLAGLELCPRTEEGLSLPQSWGFFLQGSQGLWVGSSGLCRMHFPSGSD